MCVRLDQCVCRLGRSVARDDVFDIQSAESVRKSSDDEGNVHRTLLGVTSRDREFQFGRLRARTGIRDGELPGRWEGLAVAVIDGKTLEAVTS